jgi:hypothetical protein
MRAAEAFAGVDTAGKKARARRDHDASLSLSA